MFPIITNEFYRYLINQATGYNMAAILINMPSLGLTDSPTSDQLINRRQLTLVNAVAQEIALTGGYQRSIITLPSTITTDSNNNFTLSITATFTASGAMGPFTHICYVKGANLVGATTSNGNNRGDTTGILYKVEPVITAPLTIQANVTFSHTTDITFGS